jgi:hypothetical protein
MGDSRLPPILGRPLLGRTVLGELVRLRTLLPGEHRVDTTSPWDDWGVFDVEFDGSAQERAMVEVPRDDDVQPSQIRWQPVGDMSWHADFFGPNTGSLAINIGISLAPPDRGRGIGSVAQSLLAVAMHAQGVHRVEAQTDAANFGEQKSLRRAGFKLEGTLRGAQWRADGRHDLLSYSCLPGEPTFHPL